MYYEVNASVFMQGRAVGCLFLACKELSSRTGLACIECNCIDGHSN